MKLQNHYYEIFLEIFIDLVKSQMNVFKTILCRAYSIKNKLISPKSNLGYLKAPKPTAHQFTD